MQPQSVHYQCITCYMQSYLVARPPTFILSNLRDKVHPSWVTTGDKMLRGDAAVIWALQMHVIPFFLCLLRCIPCDNVRCDPMWRWYEMQWDAQQSYLSTLVACRSTFPVSTLGPDAAGQSSLHFFHGRSITSAYIAPASSTSAYIATRIQSIFLFNIRLHYTKSLSLRIEFCTFCAAGARLTSDIISTHPQLTHHPPSSPIWIHAGPYKALTMSTPQNKKMELLLTFWCDIIPLGSLVGLILGLARVNGWMALKLKESVNLHKYKQQIFNPILKLYLLKW